ncbi:hypothetical protein A5675_18565 [Mycobacterium malmoense]|nr:hypothetical protein A5675_18565 [Mycobacterium malmoense]
MLVATGIHDAGGSVSGDRAGDGCTLASRTLLPAPDGPFDEVGSDPPGAEQRQRDAELKRRTGGKRDQCADPRNHRDDQDDRVQGD